MEGVMNWNSSKRQLGLFLMWVHGGFLESLHIFFVLLWCSNRSPFCFMNEVCYLWGHHNCRVGMSQQRCPTPGNIVDTFSWGLTLSVWANLISWGQSFECKATFSKIQLGIWLSSSGSWALITAHKQTSSGSEPSHNPSYYSFSSWPGSFISNDRRL